MRCCACDDLMQRYFNCRVRGCVRGRGYRECGYTSLLLLLHLYICIYDAERDVSGAAARVTATWRSGFRGFFFFSNSPREGQLPTDVLFLRLFIFRCRASDFYRYSPCALCKNRLRKTRGYTHLWTGGAAATAVQEVGEAIGTGVRLTSIAMYFIMWYVRVWTYNLVTCELRRFANKILVAEFNIVMMCTDLSPRLPDCVKFENVLKHAGARCRRNFVTPIGYIPIIYMLLLSVFSFFTRTINKISGAREPIVCGLCYCSPRITLLRHNELAVSRRPRRVIISVEHATSNGQFVRRKQWFRTGKIILIIRIQYNKS